MKKPLVEFRINRLFQYLFVSTLSLFFLWKLRQHFYLPQKPVTRTVSIEMRSKNPEKATRQTYYIIALRNEAGENVATASMIEQNAEIMSGCKVVNDGHGLWSDIPAMGSEFRLKTAHSARLTGNRNLVLHGGVSKPGSFLEMTVDGLKSILALPTATPGGTFSVSLPTQGTPALWKNRLLLLVMALCTLIVVYLCLAARWNATAMETDSPSTANDEQCKMTTVTVVILAVITLVGILYRVQNFTHDIDGAHVFRQSMIAANVEYMVRDGLSITTELPTKNQTLRIYDFPLYQQIAAVGCRISGAPVMTICRLLSISIYVLTVIMLFALLRQGLRFPLSFTLLALSFYTLSPLTVFYNRVPMPDNLGVLLTFTSLWSFLNWLHRNKHSFLHYFIMLVSGVAATLIKNPIYLPVCAVMAALLISSRQWKRIFSPSFIFFVFAIGASVFIFKLYVNFVNTGTFSSPEWEHYWYFSSLKDRMTLAPYVKLGRRFYTDVLPLPAALLALSALFLIPRTRYSLEQKTFLYALLSGSILTMLVFFNVNWIHNYYQLPYVVVASVFAAVACHVLLAPWNNFCCYKRVPWHALSASFLILFLCSRFSNAIPQVEPQAIKDSGLAIRKTVPANGYILYVTPNDAYWDPIYHYYAKREGYNISVSHATPKTVMDVTNKHAPSGHPVFLFIPSHFDVAATDALNAAFTDSISYPEGTLYRVR